MNDTIGIATRTLSEDSASSGATDPLSSRDPITGHSGTWRLRAGPDSCESVVIAPKSDDCFFYALTLPPTIDPRDRLAIRYELEHHLPLDAESMVIDYSSRPSNGQTIAYTLAIPWEPWREIVDAIEANGKQVLAIVPETLLICRAVAKNEHRDGQSTVVIVDGESIDWLRIDQRGVYRWQRISRDESSVKLQHAADGNTEEETEEEVALVGRCAEVAGWLSSLGYRVKTHAKPAQELMIAGASLYEKQSESGWPNLLRDDLAPGDRWREIRKPLRFAVTSAVILLLTLAVGSWWRSQRIDETISSIHQQQNTAFRTTFPNARPPAALFRRVLSEHKKMMGSRGASTSVDLPVAAPNVLGDLLEGIPHDLRFQIRRIDIANGKLDLDLLVRSPVDAGKFADALASAGFHIDPPLTEQTDAKMFQCRITGRWVPRLHREEAQP